MTLRRKHANEAASSRRWHWRWRKIHASTKMKLVDGSRHKAIDEWRIDCGYCLDRYTVDNPKEEPQ